jgi:tight adherence protein B
MIYASLVLIGIAICALIYVAIKIILIGVRAYRSYYLQSTARQLDEVYSQFKAEQYLYLSLVTGVVLGLVTFALSGNVVMGIIFLGLGVVLPQAQLKFQKRKRAKKFDEQIVDTLMLISNLLKAGTSIRNSLKTVVQEMPAPTAEEYAIVDREISLGTSLGEAFTRLCQRVDNPDMYIVNNALSIAQKTGGNLSEMFDNISRTIRGRKESQEKIDALTSQGKMQGWIIGLLPIFLLVLLNIIKPDLVYPLFHSFIGLCLLGLVVVMEVLGIFFIRKVISIDI